MIDLVRNDGGFGSVIQMILAADTLDEELRGIATFASLTLAVLTFFTTRRAQRLVDDRADGLGTLSVPALAPALLDLLLALTTLCACIAMFSLFTDSWSVSEWADRDHVAESMFSIIYLGFVAVLLVQLGLVAGRVIPLVGNSLAQQPPKSSN